MEFTKGNFFVRSIAFVVLCAFSTSTILVPSRSFASTAPTVLDLPTPGSMISLTQAYVPVIAKGLRVHPENPVLFDFILDTGNTHLNAGSPQLRSESEKIIKYFLASLTVPDGDQWVNLSPYEKDRIVPKELGETEMGRDMLAQDYILKQLTASLIYPEKQLGQEFWGKVYAKAQALYGSSAQVPVNTFNKVWITADKADIYVHDNTAFVVGAHLKVMLEEDYLSLEKHNGIANSHDTTHSIGSQIVREIILPELEKEVNTGKTFANLRQIFNSIILSVWYKKNLKSALLNQVYSNKSVINGVDVSDKTIKDQIYQQYLQAYKKGVFNYIKEEVVSTPGSPTKEQVILPRKYFSGGVEVTRGVNAAMRVLDVNPTTAFIAPAGEFIKAVTLIKSDEKTDRAVDFYQHKFKVEAREGTMSGPTRSLGGEFAFEITSNVPSNFTIEEVERQLRAYWNHKFQSRTPGGWESTGQQPIKDPDVDKIFINGKNGGYSLRWELLPRNSDGHVDEGNPQTLFYIYEPGQPQNILVKGAFYVNPNKNEAMRADLINGFVKQYGLEQDQWAKPGFQPKSMLSEKVLRIELNDFLLGRSYNFEHLLKVMDDAVLLRALAALWAADYYELDDETRMLLENHLSLSNSVTAIEMNNEKLVQKIVNTVTRETILVRLNEKLGGLEQVMNSAMAVKDEFPKSVERVDAAMDSVWKTKRILVVSATSQYTDRILKKPITELSGSVEQVFSGDEALKRLSRKPKIDAVILNGYFVGKDRKPLHRLIGDEYKGIVMIGVKTGDKALDPDLEILSDQNVLNFSLLNKADFTWPMVKQLLEKSWSQNAAMINDFVVEPQLGNIFQNIQGIGLTQQDQLVIAMLRFARRYVKGIQGTADYNSTRSRIGTINKLLRDNAKEIGERYKTEGRIIQFDPESGRFVLTQDLNGTDSNMELRHVKLPASNTDYILAHLISLGLDKEDLSLFQKYAIEYQLGESYEKTYDPDLIRERLIQKANNINRSLDQLIFKFQNKYASLKGKKIYFDAVLQRFQIKNDGLLDSPLGSTKEGKVEIVGDQNKVLGEFSVEELIRTLEALYQSRKMPKIGFSQKGSFYFLLKAISLRYPQWGIKVTDKNCVFPATPGIQLQYSQLLEQLKKQLVNAAMSVPDYARTSAIYRSIKPQIDSINANQSNPYIAEILPAEANKGHVLVRFSDRKNPSTSHFTVMADQGFRVTSWVVDSTETLKTPDDLDTSLGSGMFWMFPWVNRIKDGKILAKDGTVVDISDIPGITFAPNTNPPNKNPMHGLARVSSGWKDISVGVDARKGAYIEGVIETKDMDNPEGKLQKALGGNAKLTARFYFQDGQVTAEAKVQGDEGAIGDVALHTFQLYTPGKAKIQADAQGIFPVDDEKIPVGNPVDQFENGKNIRVAPLLDSKFDNTYMLRAGLDGTNIQLQDELRGVTDMKFTGMFSGKAGQLGAAHIWGGNTTNMNGVYTVEPTSNVSANAPNRRGEVGGSVPLGFNEVRTGSAVYRVAPPLKGKSILIIDPSKGIRSVTAGVIDSFGAYPVEADGIGMVTAGLVMQNFNAVLVNLNSESGRGSAESLAAQIKKIYPSMVVIGYVTKESLYDHKFPDGITVLKGTPAKNIVQLKSELIRQLSSKAMATNMQSLLNAGNRFILSTGTMPYRDFATFRIENSERPFMQGIPGPYYRDLYSFIEAGEAREVVLQHLHKKTTALGYEDWGNSIKGSQGYHSLADLKRLYSFQFQGDGPVYLIGSYGNSESEDNVVVIDLNEMKEVGRVNKPRSILGLTFRVKGREQMVEFFDQGFDPDDPATAKNIVSLSNAAMQVDSAMAPGGIDLNSKNLQVNERGEKINIQFNSAMVAEFKSGNFTSVRPVIISITPMGSVGPWLGLKEEDSLGKLAKI